MENLEICNECGGKCCKSSPGLIFPEDFGRISLELLKEKFQSGLYAVDICDLPVNATYFIRMKRKGCDSIFDPGRKNECSCLEQNGCRFVHDDRPVACRALIPDPPRCYFGDPIYNMINCAKAWQPYTSLIEQAFRQFL